MHGTVTERRAGQNTISPGTRVALDDPDYGTWRGRVVVCLCKRHTWQPELPGGAGPGFECGHAQCGYPRAAAACPWPVHVRWDGSSNNESHETPDSLKEIKEVTQ